MSEFTEDALRCLLDTAQEAISVDRKARLLPVDGERAFVITTNGLLTTNGELLTVRTSLPAPRRHVVYSLEDIAELTKNAPGDPSVWYSRSEVVVILDDGPDDYRKDRATLKFLPTVGYASLLRTGFIDQKTLLSKLRIELAECWESDEYRESVITPLRAINMKSLNTASAGATHGGESLERTRTAEVKATIGTIPEDIVLHVRLYDDPALFQRHEIVCALEIDIEKMTFRLTPYAGQVEAAQEQVMEVVALNLQNAVGDAIPVYFGSPGSPPS